MNNSATIAGLSTAVQQAVRSAKFCVAGQLPKIDPGLEVEGLGVCKLPLKPAAAKRLVAACQVAPYGQGTETLVNKKVRNTFELDPQKFQVSQAWNEAIASTTRAVAEQLGLPAEQLESRLYKLLVYKQGGFFLPHRDSEKHDRMVASLIVVLPNQFAGGQLVVGHGAVEQKLTFDAARKGEAACYAAFYADCEHEVKYVDSGVRLCLAYNLVLQPQRGTAAPAKPSAAGDTLAESLQSWFATQPAKPLVFAMEHHYTERGLSLDLLKGGDRQLAELVVAAAEKTEARAHLAQVSRHLTQFADDGSFGEGYYRRHRPARRKIEIGETYEDELLGSEWTDLGGQKQPWGEIPLDLSAIVASMPIDDWKPTSEEFEGYTGNAGNTLDRWYHRSAIVVWHSDQHYDMIARAGAFGCMPLFRSMATKLAKTAKKRLETARGDCVRFARAIIARWPQRVVGYGARAVMDEAHYDDFPQHLALLHDRDTTAMFLSKVAEVDRVLPLDECILVACREFGWSTFVPELKQLLASRPTRPGRHELPPRDMQWLAAFCADKTVDADKVALAQQLCALAVERFCEPFPPRTPYYSPYGNRAQSESEMSLPWLLQALLASGCVAELSRVIRFVQASPENFSLDDCQIPCLKTIVPWSRKRLGEVVPPLANWLAAVRAQLASATASAPAPPSDWARPAEVDCKCQHCAQLNAFLADPASEVGRIAAREDLRSHVIDQIQRHRCDVSHTLERKRSPFSLVLTKTDGSFQRAVKRFAADRKLLGELPAEA